MQPVVGVRLCRCPITMPEYVSCHTAYSLSGLRTSLGYLSPCLKLRATLIRHQNRLLLAVKKSERSKEGDVAKKPLVKIKPKILNTATYIKNKYKKVRHREPRNHYPRNKRKYLPKEEKGKKVLKKRSPTPCKVFKARPNANRSCSSHPNTLFQKDIQK